MKTILALALAALAAAEPEADADAYYGYGGYGGYGLGGYYGLGYGRSYGLGYGYGKREAEPYYGVYSAHHAVAPVVSYAHHAVAAPVVSHAVHTPVVSSYAQVSPSASLSTVGYAPAAIPAVGGAYAGAGRYVANSAGVVHVAKREAEADPYYYGGYGGYGHGLGYRSYGGYGLGYGRAGYFYG